ncbi:MAG TPA: tetratricopeptide repeat protein [bacterium]|nr:tetratricopeptide repeat protein [bacterium]HPQ20037.1 tetratricopeptide repeat protein [bacterium]
MFKRCKIYWLFFIVLFIFFASAFYSQLRHRDPNITFNLRKFKIFNFFKNFFTSIQDKKIYEIEKLINKNKFKEALNELNKIDENKLEKDIEFKYYYFKGRINKELNQIDEAIKFYEKADRIKPYNPELLLELSDLYLMSKKYFQAENSLKNLLELDKHNPDVIIKLSLIYNSLNKFDDKINILANLKNTNEIYLINNSFAGIFDTTQFLTKINLGEIIKTELNQTKEIVYFYQGSSLNLELANNSKVSFDIEKNNDGDILKVKLIAGECLVIKKDFSKFIEKNNIEFITPISKIIPYGTIFSLSYNEIANLITIKVFDGILYFVSLIESFNNDFKSKFISAGEEFKFSKDINVLKENVINDYELKNYLISKFKRIDYGRLELKEVLNKIELLEKEKIDIMKYFPEKEKYLYAIRLFQNTKNSSLEYKYLKLKSSQKELIKKKKLESLAWYQKSFKVFNDILKNKYLDSKFKNFIFYNYIEELNNIKKELDNG